MNIIRYIVVAAISAWTTACEPDLRIEKSIERSEYVLLCDTDISGEHLEFRYVRPLHVRSGVSVPFRPGESLGHWGTKIEEGVTYPNRAAVFFEDIHGRVSMTRIISIRDSSGPSSGFKLSDLEKAN